MTVIQFPLRPSRTDWFKLGCEIVNPEPAIRCIDPVDEELAALRILELSAEKLKLAIETGCDEQEARALALLDRVQRLLRNSNSQSTEDVSA